MVAKDILRIIKKCDSGDILASDTESVLQVPGSLIKYGINTYAIIMYDA